MKADTRVTQFCMTLSKLLKAKVNFTSDGTTVMHIKKALIKDRLCV